MPSRDRLVYDLQSCSPTLPGATLSRAVAQHLTSHDPLDSDLARRFAFVLSNDTNVAPELRELAEGVLQFLKELDL